MRSRGRGPRLARRQHGPSPQGPPSVRAPRLDRSWPMTADAGARRRGFNGCSCCYRLVNAALSVEVLSGGGPGARRCACSGCVLRGQEWLATCAHLLRCARDSPATVGHGVRHVEGDVGVAMSLRAQRRLTRRRRCPGAACRLRTVSGSRGQPAWDPCRPRPARPRRVVPLAQPDDEFDEPE
jgi:hypothetical protein